MSVDFSKVKDWDYLEEEVLINNINESDNGIEILKSKMNEFESWKDHKVSEEVENKGKRVRSVRCVMTKKKTRHMTQQTYPCYSRRGKFVK